MAELKEGDVGILDNDGARLLYAAGSPEAEAWHAENAASHDLNPPDPLPADTSPDESDTLPRDDDVGETGDAPKGPTPDTEDDAGTNPVDPQTGDDQ